MPLSATACHDSAGVEGGCDGAEAGVALGANALDDRRKGAGECVGICCDRLPERLPALPCPSERCCSIRVAKFHSASLGGCENLLGATGDGFALLLGCESACKSDPLGWVMII